MVFWRQQAAVFSTAWDETRLFFHHSHVAVYGIIFTRIHLKPLFPQIVIFDDEKCLCFRRARPRSQTRVRIRRHLGGTNRTFFKHATGKRKKGGFSSYEYFFLSPSLSPPLLSGASEAGKNLSARQTIAPQDSRARRIGAAILRYARQPPADEGHIEGTRSQRRRAQRDAVHKG